MQILYNAKHQSKKVQLKNRDPYILKVVIALKQCKTDYIQYRFARTTKKFDAN